MHVEARWLSSRAGDSGSTNGVSSGGDEKGTEDIMDKRCTKGKQLGAIVRTRRRREAWKLDGGT